MRIIIAQKNFLVGDVAGNTDIILQTIRANADSSAIELVATEQTLADIILFPELALVGYPPEDLLFKAELYLRVESSLAQITAATLQYSVAVIVGHPMKKHGECFNTISFIASGEIIIQYCKQALPNYSVFDEARYFSPGKSDGIVNFKNTKIALLICEDLWQQQPVQALLKQKPQLLIVANASPFHQGQLQKRQQLLSTISRQLNCPIIYGNLVGGQDELVFDGASMAYDAQGQLQMQSAQFKETLSVVQFKQGQLQCQQKNYSELLTNEAELYQALLIGVRDYVKKNGFKGAVIGLSGGIDSALTLAIAVDALGAENVTAVMMPFRYTSSMSLEDAATEASKLKVNYEVISIEPIYQAFVQQLSPLFKNTSKDSTEENLQARCRGVILMAMSNKFGSIVLTTGNKSEMAVGYATLYGDMAGGYAVLKDVFKMDVFKLARYRNQSGEVIPERVITRPPSAELSADQVDEDSLPPYQVLDAILAEYIEKEQSLAEIVALGNDSDTVAKILKLVDINEHKRRQSPPGVRVTGRAFGRDHRYPITSAYRRQPVDIDAEKSKLTE